MDTRSWSVEQEAIFNEFARGTGHFIVDALAGTGKTTTILEGVKRSPERKVTICAFNAKIKDELNSRLKRGATRQGIVAKTLHAIGFGIVMRYWEGVGVYDSDKHPISRADMLTNEVAPTAPDAIKRLISSLHSLARETMPHALRGHELVNLALDFDMVPDESWDEQGFGLDYVCDCAARAMDIAGKVKPVYIDFSDMIFLPLRNHWAFKTQDMVVVDEAQDMTAAQLELAMSICRGRIVLVGDRNQAIYAFRGADSNSLSRLQGLLRARSLPLTTTYRCGHAIVAEAQRFVPAYVAAESNPAGAIEALDYGKLVAEAVAGDFILSRVNAPLVATAMALIKSGKRTRIAGRTIGKGLVSIIKKLKARSVPELLARINAWGEKQTSRIQARFKGSDEALKSRLDSIRDQVDMLSSIAEGCSNVSEVEGRITSLFADDGLGDASVVTCSSVHRSKGLEAKRVFVLADTLKDWNQEELNIQYVAITRAIETLVYVRGL